MRKVLDYTIPPIKCYLHHAFPLGVFWNKNNQNIMNWFCLNYNYIFGKLGPKNLFYSFFMNYNSIPFLQKRDIYGDELENYLSSNSFYTFVRQSINNGNIVEVMADMYYLEENYCFKKEHCMHETLILGYDDVKNTFIIRGYFKKIFKEMEVPQSQIIPFQNCAYYGDNVAIKLYRKKEDTFLFDSKSFLLQLNDYYNSINPSYRVSFINGTYYEPWQKSFGMEVYNLLIEYINTANPLDYKPLRVVQEHFESMKIKLEYIKKQKYIIVDCLDEIISYYAESSAKADIIVRLALKQTLVSFPKNEELKHQIIEQLKELISSEQNKLKQFLEEANSKTNIFSLY